MPDNDANPQSSRVQVTYHSMEEVNEALGAMGWDGEFRQLSKGRVTSRWRSLHLGPCSLTSHRLDQRIHVRQVPPGGCVAMAIIPPTHFLSVDGAKVANNEVILAHSGSEPEFVTPSEAECDALAVPRSVFEASERALFPGMQTNGRPVRVFQCAPSGWSALGREMKLRLRDGRMSPEDVADLLSRFLDLMAGESKNRREEKGLGNGSARRVARRAQDHIEAWYPHTIRMEDLCRSTGVSLRTLQRSFALYFQMSPSEFIRARRLNAARRGLLAAEPLNGNVTKVALGAGFTHLGRFAVEYREHFGESPNETLAKRAPLRTASAGT